MNSKTIMACLLCAYLIFHGFSTLYMNKETREFRFEREEYIELDSWEIIAKCAITDPVFNIPFKVKIRQIEDTTVIVEATYYKIVNTNKPADPKDRYIELSSMKYSEESYNPNLVSLFGGNCQAMSVRYINDIQCEDKGFYFKEDHVLSWYKKDNIYYWVDLANKTHNIFLPWEMQYILGGSAE